MISNMHSMYQIVLGSFALLYYSIVRCHVPYARPGFLSDSIHLEPEINDTILIPCVIHDLGKNSIRWWKDGLLIYDSEDYGLITPPRFTVLTNQNILMVDWVNLGDTGNYTCQIILAYPRYPLEQIHTVRVRHAAKVLPFPPEGEVEVILGNEVHIGCMASGWPTPVVKWLFKDKVIESLDEKHKLIFRAEDPQQAGVYVCEATNNAGKPARSSIIVNIYYAPKIKVRRTWVHASPGMKTDIKCEVTGEPVPKVEWFFNSEPLRRDSLTEYRIQGDEHILTFRNLQDSDFGQYTCKARNKVGEVEQSIELSGNDLFIPTHPLWGFRLSGKDREISTIRDECIAINAGESPDCSAAGGECRLWRLLESRALQSKSGLAYPAVFKNSRGLIAPDSYNFIWEVESYSPIIEYKLLFREVNGERDWIQLIIPADINAPGPIHSKSYTLTGMKLSTVYQAHLISRNRFGWSQPSETIEFASELNETTTEGMVTPVSGPITSGVSCLGVILTIPVTIGIFLLQTFPLNL